MHNTELESNERKNKENLIYLIPKFVYLEYIFNRLEEFDEICNCQLTCKRWNQILSSNHSIKVWENLLKKNRVEIDDLLEESKSEEELFFKLKSRMIRFHTINLVRKSSEKSWVKCKSIEIKNILKALLKSEKLNFPSPLLKIRLDDCLKEKDAFFVFLHFSLIEIFKKNNSKKGFLFVYPQPPSYQQSSFKTFGGSSSPNYKLFLPQFINLKQFYINNWLFLKKFIF